MNYDWNAAPDVLSINEAAEILRCSYNAVRNLCHSKGFPALKFCRAWRISAPGLRRWIDNLGSSSAPHGLSLLPAGEKSCLPGGDPNSNVAQFADFVTERKS